MKKGILVFLIVFLLCGCQTQETKDTSQEFELYDQIKQNIIDQDQFDTDYPFDIDLVYNELDDGYRYDVIIKDPQVDMYDMIAFCYVDETNEKMCPTLGIFDQETFSLKVDYVNKSEGFYKGVQLSGTTLKKQDMKLYVQYYLDEKKENKVEQYIEGKVE